MRVEVVEHQGENESRVRKYLNEVAWRLVCIGKCICSHRDADHIRGVRKLRKWFPSRKILDAGVEGRTTESNEYGEYMRLRRKAGAGTDTRG